jgi:cytochrome c oxidase subunit 4
MSDHAQHGHGGHGKDHVPHVLPLSTYFKTWGALMVLTVITVGASYVNFGPGNLVIAMLIATAKAATVALVFMHLYYDHKFHGVIFVSSLVFLGIFIAFTMFDTESRGRAEAIEGEHPVKISDPFGGTMSEAAAKEKIKPAGAHEGEAHH